MRTLLLVAAVAIAVTATTYTQKGIHTTQGPGQLGQINDHTCGPHALMQSIFKVTGIDMKEATLATWAGTTTSGTSHQGIEAALKKFNSEKSKKLTIAWHYYSAVSEAQIGQWMNNNKTAVFFHMLYRDKWGHYELPYQFTTGTGIIRVANSLGRKKDTGFLGYIENRTWTDENRYVHEMGQPQVCVVTNPN